VVQRGDGAFAYNLAVVVDDADQGVEEVVRGSDLADSTPRQLWLARALGLPEPSHAHVPLVLGPDGARLAKRHGDVTLRELPPAEAIAWIGASLGFSGAEPREWPAEFDPARLPTADTTFTPRGDDSSG
jgi:glutamyl-tRNA synthetase